jgi:hypothetical protein
VERDPEAAGVEIDDDAVDQEVQNSRCSCGTSAPHSVPKPSSRRAAR